MQAQPMVVADALTRSFGERRVVGPLSSRVERGERVALVGPNGSGKSSFLRCVVGALTPSSGTLMVGGQAAGTRAARALIGASLSQERSFYLRLTGLANLLVFAQLRAPADRARADVRAVVEELELDEIVARRLDACSKGMVQQLALARALAGEPALLVLDEPTRSLDSAAIDRLWTAVERRPELTLLIATHRPEDVARCDRTLEFAA